MQAVLAGMLVHSIGPSPCLQWPVGVWQVHVSVVACQVSCVPLLLCLLD